jgi:1-acyl-sn-glycerol-3-phosphate acyltransferase
LRYELIGMERLERDGLLILANHPSLIDTVFLMALTRNAVGVLKAQLQRNFFMRGVVSATGYIFNDQGYALIDACIDALGSGSNLIMFPEGTRSGLEGALQLKRGAANIALRAHSNITPVVISCVPRMLPKGQPWWRVPARRAVFRIEVHEDIDITRFKNESGNDAVAARHLTAFLQTYFTEEVQRHVCN